MEKHKIFQSISTNKGKEVSFLLQNRRYFIDSVSMIFSFTLEHLRKYQSILSWNYLAVNLRVKWSQEIIEEFQYYFFIEQNVFEINLSEAFPWSISFIEKFYSFLEWELLSQNPCIVQNLEIRNHFKNELNPFVENFLPIVSFGDRISDKIKSDVEFLEKNKELNFKNLEDIINSKSINWQRLSMNTQLPWSVELIETFLYQWDWACLSTNDSIPWNFEMMKYFEQHINWGKNPKNDSSLGSLELNTISSNHGIVWDSQILCYFRNKLIANEICIKPNINWNIDLLTELSEFWDYKMLCINDDVWETVFLDFNKEELIIPLLDYILEENNLPNKIY